MPDIHKVIVQLSSAGDVWQLTLVFTAATVAFVTNSVAYSVICLQISMESCSVSSDPFVYIVVI